MQHSKQQTHTSNSKLNKIKHKTTACNTTTTKPHKKHNIKQKQQHKQKQTNTQYKPTK